MGERSRGIVSLIFAIALCEGIGVFGGIFTRAGIESGWYASLAQPAAAPPSWVFGPVWFALYALMGIAAWLVLKARDRGALARIVALWLFALQLAAHALWPALFFGMQNLGLALLDIGILWLLVVATMAAFARVSRAATWLLAPYLAWVSFAAYLNLMFMLLNTAPLLTAPVVSAPAPEAEQESAHLAPVASSPAAPHESSPSASTLPPPSAQSAPQDAPPLKLRGIGVNFDDFVFTKESLQFKRIFMGFGFVIPAAMSSTGADKMNPQPTYILPLGTPVRSLVDGIVANTPTLWSGDTSIQVTADGKMGIWIYETEHVRNPRVKMGDHVTAGEIIAEVGNFGNIAPAGYGAVEIGILKGGQTPEHVCPYAYLDDSIKASVLAGLKDLFARWEVYTGDPTLYDENEPIPGCRTLEAIPG